VQSDPGGGGRYTLALISRRSRRHPGTRYLARGLNDRAGPGNEIECELLLWTHPAPGRAGAPSGGAALAEPLRWARCVWRRGTVPVWWGVNLRSLQKGLAAEVYVRSEDAFVGTLSYFRELQRQHSPPPPCPPAPAAPGALPGAAGADAGAGESGAGSPAASEATRVTCVNLLHCNPRKESELMLSEAFEGVRRLASLAAVSQQPRPSSRRLCRPFSFGGSAALASAQLQRQRSRAAPAVCSPRPPT
jgi:hypothetical protein